jgi:hypothetical protein
LAGFKTRSLVLSACRSDGMTPRKATDIAARAVYFTPA